MDTNIHIFCADKYMVDRKVTVSLPRFVFRQVTMSLPRTLPKCTTHHDNQKAHTLGASKQKRSTSGR